MVLPQMSLHLLKENAEFADYLHEKGQKRASFYISSYLPSQKFALDLGRLKIWQSLTNRRALISHKSGNLLQEAEGNHHY